MGVREGKKVKKSSLWVPIRGFPVFSGYAVCSITSEMTIILN
jgi:hypothetical protein